MRILFDIAHPAHVHFFKHMIQDLQSHGHEIAIVSREKDVTCELLDRYGLEYVSVGRAGNKGRGGQLAELLHRDWSLWRISRSFRPDVILTRNPAGVQAARLCGAIGIFDTDDGRAAGIHFRAAAPFAHIITTPDCLIEDYGNKHVKYPGYKQSAYLHPDHFTPDPGVLAELGVAEGERFFLVRFVAMVASHDAGEAGLSTATKTEIIRRLKRKGRVFISSEGDLPEDFQAYRISLPAHRMHDVIAFASLLVGDSQTMAAEAAVIGTPSLRLSSFAGRISYLEELEHEYGLTRAFRPGQEEAIFHSLDEALAAEGPGDKFQSQHRRMLQDKCNVAKWYVEKLGQGVFGLRG